MMTSSVILSLFGRTILSVAGKQLALTERLEYLHYGQPWKSGTDDYVEGKMKEELVESERKKNKIQEEARERRQGRNRSEKGGKQEGSRSCLLCAFFFFFLLLRTC